MNSLPADQEIREQQMKVLMVGVRSHPLLDNAPPGYCIIEAEVQEYGRRFLIQAESSSHTKGTFSWSEVDPETLLCVRYSVLVPAQIQRLAHSLKTFFDHLAA